MSFQEEKNVMQMGLEALSRIGVRPRVYRSPYWDFSPNTLSILEENGFSADSSLMGNDFHPYLIRRVEVNADKGNAFGSTSSVLEIPVSWYLDDFPPEEYITGRQEGMNPAVGIFDRWKAIFDYAIAKELGACYVVTTHPQTIGRAHMISRLEELIEYMNERGAWFATLSEICDATQIAC